MKLISFFICLLILPARPAGEALHASASIALSESPADSIASALEAKRVATHEWLRASPTSYLAAIARVDFGDRDSLTVGKDPGNDVVIPGDVFADHHLSVSVVGDSFRVRTVDPSARFVVSGDTVMGERMLGPTYISVGSYILRLSHQRFPAIIVFDPSSPRFAEFKGLSFFPVDLRYRFILAMDRNPQQDTVVILSTRGNMRHAVREGWFRFTIEGIPCTLEVSRLLEPGIGDHVYSIFFRDKTSGIESYPLGRYLDVERREDGMFVLDFNTAYNPACAISPYYNCPLPPEQNTLPVRIPAGEKDPQYLSH